MKRIVVIASALAMSIILFGCTLFLGKTFDKKLGNNPEAADCAKAWQDKGTKEGVPQKWYVKLEPSKMERNIEEYRKKVTKAKIAVQLTGKSVSKWRQTIEKKKKMPNPYLPWPDGWLKDTLKKIADGAEQDKKLPYIYPNADVTLTLLVSGKVGAIAKCEASSKKSSVEVHY